MSRVSQHSASPYVPSKKIEMRLKELCRNYRKKYQVYSMFYYDRYANTINICTTQPGYWIGKNGKDVYDLEAFCNSEIDRINEQAWVIKNSELGEEHLDLIPHIRIVFCHCCSA